MSLLQMFASTEQRSFIEDEVDSLLEEMTLEEKVGQLNQLNGTDQTGPAVEDMDLEAEIRAGHVGSVLNVDGFETRKRYQELAVEESRLGIPLLFGFDVIHGYRTIFPIPLGETASWDPDVAEAAARVAASETAAAGIHWTFGPPVDVTRDARWGRAMETSGEDPYLASEFATARVCGFQGDDLRAKDTVLSCAKHYAAYGDVKAGREYNTVDISESTLRDFHLPPFKAAVDAGVGTLMNAFTTYDGVPAGASTHLLRDILKDEWGFEGFVVSDWNSFREFIYHGVAGDEHDAAKLAIEAGSDMDMVGHIFATALADLVRAGDVNETLVDEAVRRVLRTKFLLGLFDDPYRYFDEERRSAVIQAAAHHETARDAARKSIVLLKNEKDILPLSNRGEIAVVGDLADDGNDAIGDWRARGRPQDAITVRDGIESAADSSTTVRFAQGYERPGTVTDELRDEAIETVTDADVAIVAVGETWELSGEASARSDITLPGDQRDLLEELVATETPVVAILTNGRPLAIPWMDENIPAILETWFLGTQAGNAIADVLFGEYNPSGNLPISFPRAVGQVPIQYNQLPTGRPLERAEPGWGTSYLDTPNDPLYAFGHGLSYTQFEYSDLELNPNQISPGETVTASVIVENTGTRPGEEVIQLYTHDVVANRSRPEKELSAFEKVRLEPGERRKVTLFIEPDSLAFWTTDEEIAVEPGEFEVLVGRSSDDIRETGVFEVQE
ncbi:beta-glucosidase BglX [Haladaptatus caseinilyticus]|uniref:beta-glucosidase BglX n=1 Tax=Haladaptatus caseinilyticus TaxID=2993314 RepID=UPI00224A8668|nr:beta-glucosidase BglX [Haladaptatus caseinilyticus]